VLLEPVLRVGLATLWAMAIVAGMVSVMPPLAGDTPVE